MQLHSVQMSVSNFSKPLLLQDKKQTICDQARTIQAYAHADCGSLNKTIHILAANTTLFLEADVRRSDILTNRQVWEHLMTTERITADLYRATIQANAQSALKSSKTLSDFSFKIKLAQEALSLARDNKYFLCLINAVKMKHDCVRDAIEKEIVTDSRIAHMLQNLSDDILCTNQHVAANFFDGVTDTNIILHPSNR